MIIKIALMRIQRYTSSISKLVYGISAVYNLLVIKRPKYSGFSAGALSFNRWPERFLSIIKLIVDKSLYGTGKSSYESAAALIDVDQ